MKISEIWKSCTLKYKYMDIVSHNKGCSVTHWQAKTDCHHQQQQLNYVRDTWRGRTDGRNAWFSPKSTGNYCNFYQLPIYQFNIAVWTVDNSTKQMLFFSILWRDIKRSCIPHPGLHRSCTPACAGLGPAASGMWQCTSRWLCHTLHGDAPRSPWWWCRSEHQPEHSVAQSCRLEAVHRKTGY